MVDLFRGLKIAIETIAKVTWRSSRLLGQLNKQREAEEKETKKQGKDLRMLLKAFYFNSRSFMHSSYNKQVHYSSHSYLSL